MTGFLDLGLHQQLLKALEKLGFSEPTEVQQQAVPKALNGRDVLVSAKTGSGKTAAFILPMLHLFLSDDKPRSSTRGLILLPTRELALQTQKIFEQLAAYTHIKSGLIIGGEAFKFQVASIRKNPEVFIATPGRLVEHLEKGNLDFSDIETFVLDEADRMLDMGFAEDMQKIASACNPERQTLLFSATLKHKAFGALKDTLKQPVHVRINSREQGHSEIVQQLVLADDDRHKENLAAALIAEEEANRVFVFCKTRAECQKVSNMLRAKKLNVAYIHGEVSQSDRKQVMNRFRDGKLQVLVATDVAARGLDIKDIDLVINFTVAQSGDDHVHRVGRTGRAGEKGLAITLINALEWNQMSSIERYLKIRFEPRKVKGLVANYTGPKKLKKSGKAAGTKKKKTGKPQSKQKPAKASPRAADRKDVKREGTRKGGGKEGGNKTNTSHDTEGFAPFRRKK